MQAFSQFIIETKELDKLQSHFKDIGDKLKGDFHEHLKGRMMNAIEKAKEHDGKNYHQLFSHSQGIYHYQHPHRDLMMRVFKRKEGDHSLSAGHHIVPNHEAIVDKLAKDDAEEFHSGFIHKNTAKLGGIVGDKKIKSIKHSIGRNLDGRLSVEHHDGSGFTASFNTVSKVSKNGKWFHQWPTRFHNVVKSDGTKMKSASEAKMKKEFF